VLQDLDHSIAALLKAELPSSITSSATITFAPPDSHFPPSYVTLPAIDLFLFAVEENHDLRNFQPSSQRQTDGTVVTAPRRPQVDCHYMISAFPVPSAPSPDDDEHRLLGEVMRVLIRHRRLPDQVLQGSLVSQFTSVRALTLAAAVNMRQPGIDMWQALQTRPRATIHYVVTVSVDTGQPTVLEVPATDVQIAGGP
jgi:Pvc16 N-terminal domain